MTGQWQLLAREFDDVEWESRTDEEVAASIIREPPQWLRIANFYSRSLSLLRLLPAGQLILWKLEHWGSDTTYDRVPKSRGVCPRSYVDALCSFGHHIRPYTFTERNKELLYEEVPLLRELGIDVIPIAQKCPVGNTTGSAIRTRLGVKESDTLIGAGGLLHPAKGIDEIAVWFLRNMRDPSVHLLCSVVADGDGETERTIRRRWERAAGINHSHRVHIHVGNYGQWVWMCSFYRAIDVMLVNSISDSWGRMASESIGFSVPTIVRRADCATNHIVPDVVLVENFAQLTASDFERLLREASGRAAELAGYVEKHYALPVVRSRFLGVLRAHTPQEQVGEFERLLQLPQSLGLIDAMVDH